MAERLYDCSHSRGWGACGGSDRISRATAAASYGRDQSVAAPGAHYLSTTQRSLDSSRPFCYARAGTGPGSGSGPGRTQPPPEPPPVEIAPQGNQAVVALLDSVRNYVNGGEYDKAAAALERALRIEPRNAGIWHDLGQIRLRQGQYRQAESMASKSNSLAGNNRGLQARNWRLIAFARRSAGDIAGAEAAEAQAVVLGG